MELNEVKLQGFLAKQGIEDYSCKKIAGDCSFRSYYRIKVGEKSLILMFAPPAYEDIKPFIQVGELLLGHGLAAPKMFGFDFEEGFLLLEDFGDLSYNKSMKDGGAGHEEFLYKNAIDALIKVQGIAKIGAIAKYNHEMLFRELMVYIDWYLDYKGEKFSLEQMKRFKDEFFKLFDKLNWQDKTLVLRDYHADNLMYLQGKGGVDSVGLLDFQDAVVGSSAYDLVSLIEDARRDVDLDLGERLIEYYLQKNPKIDREKFLQDYKILSLQRNVKILGIFARMAKRSGQNSYLGLIPRVQDHISRTLDSDDGLFGGVKKVLVV